ncbi:MAG: formylglycine-generating enzyme family protein [Candidatus Aminicenantes bacterium]|nr:formylglycine-generating enzyme family protein [Candidatus Aminicenantes bacterium]
MRRNFFGMMLIVFLMCLPVLAQDIKMEVVKDEWQVIPFFALTGKGEPVTDLQKRDVELLRSGQNSREFLLFKKAFTMGGKSDREGVNTPGRDKKKVIIFFFDNLFAGKKALDSSAATAAGIVRRAEKSVKFKVMSAAGDARAVPTGVALKDREYIQGKIKEKTVKGPGYNRDVKIKLFYQAVENLYLSCRKMKGSKFIYIFCAGEKRGNWGDYKDLTVLYFQQTGGVLFFIDVEKAQAGGKTGGMFNRELAQASGGKYITGSKTAIIKGLDRMHSGYYELVIPALKEFSSAFKQVTVSSTRRQVVFHTAGNFSKSSAPPLFDKQVKKERRESGSPAGQKGKTGVGKQAPAVDPGAAAAVESKEMARILDLLQNKRYDLERATSKFICGQAIVYLKQDRIGKARQSLQLILETAETNTDPVRSAIAGLEKLLSRGKELETLLEQEKQARRDWKGSMQSLHSKAAAAVEAVSSGEPAPARGEVKTAIKKMQDIVDRARAQTAFAAQAFKALTTRLGMADIAKINNPGHNKAQKYGKLLADVEKAVPRQLRESDPRRSLAEELLSRLKKITAQAGAHVDSLRLTLQKLAAVDEPACNDFIFANFDQFSLSYRKGFYKKKLAALGVDAGLLNSPTFIDVAVFARKITKNHKGSWEGEFADNTVLIYVPGGTFAMGLAWETGGAQDESPQHEVFLDGYWIAKYETTFFQFDVFCNVKKRGRPADGGFGRRKRPVVNVTWEDAAEYCRWLTERSGLNFRLPTEAEWEKAARGKAGWKYPWGNAKPDGRKANFADRSLRVAYERNNPATAEEVAWMDKNVDDNYTYTAPVGKYTRGASPYGVMDMAGNVWEYVKDWYDGDYYQRSPQRNPAGPFRTGYIVIRGGGWDSHQWMLRSTTRAGGVPGKTSDVVGFRVAARGPVRTGRR